MASEMVFTAFEYLFLSALTHTQEAATRGLYGLLWLGLPRRAAPASPLLPKALVPLLYPASLTVSVSVGQGLVSSASYDA